MSEEQTILAGKVVALKYTLRDAAGAMIDASEEGDPLHYLHGADNIVPGLESALEGHKPRDAETIWQWRNDSIARAASIDPAPFT